MSEYRVHLPVFEGPLDLLLHLLQKEKLDIWDVSCAAITAQYLEYLSSLEELDLEAAGEYLVMTATLIRLKARRLLPSVTPEPEEEEAPVDEAELIRRLEEYRTFKSLAGELQRRLSAWSLVVPRWETGATPPATKVVWPNPAGKATPHDLASLLVQLLAEQVRREQPMRLPVRHADVAARIQELRELLATRGSFRLLALLRETPDLPTLIGTFLGVLELVRLGEARAVQAAPFDDIEVLRIDKEDA